MSLAVSAVVRPSRTLGVFMGFIYVGLFLVGAVLLSAPVRDLILPIRTALLVICASPAFCGLYRLVRNRTRYQIDISGLGQIRLTVLLGKDLRQSTAKSRQSPLQGTLVKLMPDSTIWANIMLLRLQGGDGCISTLTIAPDSVSLEDFRKLAVALRWIANHGNSTEREIF